MPRTRRQPVSSDKRFRKPGRGECGPRERWQHSGRVLEPTERAGIVVERATEEHILDILMLKNILNAKQLQAGLRFKDDYHQASLAAHVTGSYSGLSNMRDFFRGDYERNDRQEHAYRRWRNAVEEMGVRYSGAVIATACHDAAPRAHEISLLQCGLLRLARWYGLD